LLLPAFFPRSKARAISIVVTTKTVEQQSAEIRQGGLGLRHARPLVAPQLFFAAGLAPALFNTIDCRGDWLAATGTTYTIAKMAWAFAKLDHRASSSLSTSSTGATATTFSTFFAKGCVVR
jgi:hypothetical protein